MEPPKDSSEPAAKRETLRERADRFQALYEVAKVLADLLKAEAAQLRGRLDRSLRDGEDLRARLLASEARVAELEEDCAHLKEQNREAADLQAYMDDENCELWKQKQELEDDNAALKMALGAKARG
jgi:hypothetical protein